MTWFLTGFDPGIMNKIKTSMITIMIVLSMLASITPATGATYGPKTRTDFETPDKFLEWTMDDLAFNASGSINVTGKVFRVKSNITVAPKDTLLIRPGEVLKFSQNTGIKILGTLKARGTTASPIVIGSNSTVPKAGDWNGLLFDGSKAVDRQRNSIVEQSRIEHASTGITCINSSVTLKNILVNSTKFDGVQITTSQPKER